MSIRVTQNSFSKGIISPSLQGRIDLEQYNLGLKRINNGFVLQEGCIANRSGLEFLVKTKHKDKKCRLIPFIFNLSQNYILEFGDKYIRFIKDGGYILSSESQIYEIETPYSEKEIFDIKYTQQNDVITLVHPSHLPYELSRIEHNNWLLKEISFAPLISPPTNLSIKYTGSTDSNTRTYEYVVCSVEKNTFEESSRSSKISVVGHLEAFWTTSEYITISWSAVVNACEYNVYRAVNGVFGYIGTTETTSFKDDNIEPDLTSCAPVATNPFQNEYPSTVCYFQQRKVYAASNKKPQIIWASQSGTNNNFNISRPLNATDAITLGICDNVSNKIQHLIPFDDLIVMTSNAEWCVNGSDGVMSATPTPVAKIQSCYGSSNIMPVISGSMILFVQSGGNIVRDLGYDYYSNSYDGQELSLFASHLFEGKQIIDMAYSKEPYRILWCVMNDGTVCALTYNSKQKISAWHTHTTKGEFESVATIRENNEDIAYFVVKREINGEIIRYIERFKSRVVKDLKDAFFLDCAIKQEFEEEVSEISGLDFLANCNVNALLDYGVVEDLKVDIDGKLKLPYKTKNVLVGLSYSFEVETLNLEGEGTLGLNKLINEINVKILNSREDFFVQNDNGKLNQNPRSYESVNYPLKLFSKEIKMNILSNPDTQKSITIVQKYPLPLQILAISAVLSIEEIESR